MLKRRLERPIMADAVWNPLVNIDPRYFLTGDVVERLPAERPKHDTIEAIIDWLAGPAQHIPLLVREFDEYAWRMLAAGFPLLRVTLQWADRVFRFEYSEHLLAVQRIRSSDASG
jgi:hypothetical protein